MKKTIIIAVFIIFKMSFFGQVVANFVGTPTLICVGQTVQFTDLSTGGPTTWNWTFPGGSPATSTLQNVVVTYTNAGTYNVSLIANNGGFPSLITKNNYITVIAAPATPTPIIGSSSSCSGQSGNYTVTPVSGASSYSWTVPVGSSILSGQGTNTITVNFGSTSGNVCVTASNACGTSAASCMSVTINPPPTVLVNPTNTTICSGSSTTLTASGASTYSWSPSSGLSSTIGATVTASPTITTTYSVVGTTTSGCTNSATTNIIVNPNPTVTINPTAPTICTGGSVTLTASGASTYSWSPGTGLSSTTGASVIASPTANTTYTVVGTATTGCQGSVVVTVTVTNTPPSAPGAVIGSSTPCSGQATSYFVLPVTNVSTYSWTVPAGATILSGQGTNTLSVNLGLSSGNICVTASNACGTSAASCLSVTPVPPPVISVNPTNTTICSGSSTTLTASGASTYSWSPSSGLSSTIGATVTASPTITTTYSVVGTTTAGCTNSATTNITVNPNPTITITPNAPSICVSGSVTLTASGASTYSWSPGTGLSSTTGASVIASPTITTTYTATGTSTTGCSGASAVTVTVTIAPPLTPGPIFGSSFGCIGQTGSYSVAPVFNTSSYSWTVPVGGVILSGQGTNSISVLFIFNSPGNVCVTASNACGTSAASCMSVTINPPPTVLVSPTNTTICSGSSTTLTASGASTYSWSPSSGLSSTIGATVTASPTITTTYSVVGTTTAGCTNSATTNITVNPNPTITITPNAPSICASGSVTLTASGASTYSWSPGTGLSSTTGASVIASPTITTTYTATGTSTTGCKGSAAVTVTVTITPPLTPGPIFGSSIGCIGQAGSYSVAPVFGASNYSWTVPTGATILSGQGTNTITLNYGTSSGNICVTASNACGTSAASCMSVTLNPSPSVSVSPASTTICAGSSVTLTASGASAYSWSPSSGLSSTIGATVTASPTLATTYSVVGTATNGCTNSATVNVIMGPSPTITVLPNAPSICIGGSVTLNASGASTYTWSPSIGLSSTFGSTVIASPITTTNYTVVGTTTAGCKGSDVVTVNVSNAPPPAPFFIIGSQSGCTGQPGIYFVLPVATASSYSWTVPFGSLIVSGQGTNSITVLSLLSSTGNVCVTASNGCGTSSATCLSVTITPPPTIAISPALATICAGSSTTLTASGANIYNWSPATGLNNPFSATVIASPSVTTTYSVTGTTTAGCTDTQTVTVTVSNSGPGAPGAIFGSSNVCISQAAQNYSIAAVSGATSYSWSAPPSYSIITGQGTSQVSVATSSVSGNICVVAINGCGTSPSSCFSVNVNGPPLLAASIIPATCTQKISDNNGSILLSNFSSADKVDFVIGLTYTGTATYSSANFIPLSGIITNTLANPTNTVAYTLRLFSSVGCTKDTTLILVSSDCLNELFIPDSYTPDGDGINDLFVIKGLPIGIENTLTVYNRWGNKVYSKENYDNTWNGYPNVSGTMGTEKLHQGTYYYILEFKGGDLKNRNGFIVLEY